MPLTITPTFDPPASRVVLEVAGAPASTSYVTVRRVAQQVTTIVRGATALVPTSGAVTCLDWEFTPGVENTYRVSAYSAAGAVIETSLPAPLTPDQPRMWLKSVGRPFLSRPVTLVDPGEGERRSRSTAFDIVGTRDAVAVNDQHTTRARTIRLLAANDDEVDQLDLLTSLGDVMLLQMPPGAPFRSFYANVGGTKITPMSRRSPRRYVELPLTEVAAPDATVNPSSATWRTVLSTFSTWSSLASAQRSWQAVAQLVGTPTDVWVT